MWASCGGAWPPPAQHRTEVRPKSSNHPLEKQSRFCSRDGTGSFSSRSSSRGAFLGWANPKRICSSNTPLEGRPACVGVAARGAPLQKPLHPGRRLEAQGAGGEPGRPRVAPGEPLRRAEEEKPINPLHESSSCGERTRRGEERRLRPASSE